MLCRTVPDREETQKGKQMRERLIDINELEPDADYSDYVGDFTAYSIFQIERAFEVEAITIEWIENFLDEHGNLSVEEMLEKWKEERKWKK